MFDLSTINFIDDTNRKNNYSFVGLQHNAESGKIDFYLPIGFEEFPRDSFEATKELFLGLYKVFKKFQKNKIKNRDGNINAQGGFEFQAEDNETIVLYSKINMFDTILDEFDEMEIYAFDVKRTSSDYIDFSKLDRYIDRAFFLEDDIIYLDEVEIQRDVLEFDTAELVEMFCYIYTDIKKALNDDEDIAEHIISFGINFKEKYLTYDSSLFEKDSFEITKDILKERLDIIDKKSLLKDSVYNKYYKAIYTFLYGNPFFEGDDDIYWGIDNFAFVWEEMGHYYFFKNFKDKILFADTDRFETTDIGGKKCYKRDGFEYPFVLNYEEQNKYLYPDLFILEQITINKLNIDIDKAIYMYQHPSEWEMRRKEEELQELYINCMYDGFDRIEYDIALEEYERILIFYKIGIKDELINLIGEEKFKDKYGFKKTKYGCLIPKYATQDYKNKDERDNDIKTLVEKINNDYIEMKKVCRLIDFKYKVNILDTSKIDIIKQLIYKLALESRDDKSIVENRFYIPSFSMETDKASIENIHNTNIDVLYLNFKDAQKSYLEYSYE